MWNVGFLVFLTMWEIEKTFGDVSVWGLEPSSLYMLTIWYTSATAIL